MMSGRTDTARGISRKAYATRAIQEMILRGELSIGQPVPPERDLSAALGVSRPVVHEAMGALASIGLVRGVPRQGSGVHDFRTRGSLALFASLVQYADGPVARELLEGMFSIRELLEAEAARLAALKGTEEQFASIRGIVEEERRTGPTEIDTRVELDFSFHHAVSEASGNMLLPLFLNTFKPVYTNLSHQFYRDLPDPAEVTEFHVRLCGSLAARDAAGAERCMRAMLRHGAEKLRGFLSP
jgi:GntR family transcriptional activator of glc operon